MIASISSFTSRYPLWRKIFNPEQTFTREAGLAGFMIDKEPLVQGRTMFKTLSIIIVCLLSAWVQPLRAETQVPQVSDGPIRELLLGRSLMLFEDEGASLTLADIRSGQYDHQFQPSNRDFPSLRNSRAHFWVRLLIRNISSSRREVLLENRYPLLDFITVYGLQEDGLVSEKTLGDEIDYEERPIAFRFPVFKIILEPGDNIFYLQLRNKGPFTLNLFLWDEPSFTPYAKHDTLVIGMLYGALAVLFLYNVFLTFSFHSKTYLIYVAYIIAFVGLQFGLQATAIEWIGGSLGNWVMNRGWLPMASLSHVFGCLFAIRFLNTRVHMPRWRIWLFALAFINTLVVGHGLFGNYDLIAKEVSFTTVVVSLSLIISGVVSASRGFRPAIFYTLAWMSVLLGNLLITLMLNGLIPLSVWAQLGSLIGGVMEAVLMSFALGDRINFLQAQSERTIKELNKALQTHLEEVENIVHERTATIRSIIDHVKSGFLTINRELEIEAGFTKSCYRLFGEHVRANADITDVLGLQGSLQRTFQLAVKQAFADDLPEMVTLSQIPKTFRINGHVLILEGGLIRDEQGKPKAILFTVNDITKLRRKQREALRSSMLIKILKNMEAFKSFIKITRENLQQLKHPEFINKPHLGQFILHTIKGNSLIFNMKTQADQVHRLEEKTQLESADVEAIEATFKQFLTRYTDVLGLAWDEDVDEDIAIKHSILLSLKAELGRLGAGRELLNFYDRWLRGISARSAGSLLGPIVEDVQQLAKRTGRMVQFEVRGADIKIYTEAEKNLVKSLVHLVRNAILHGIELDRAACGKNAKGQVILSFVEKDELLCISCSDDGKGIDREHMIKILHDKGLMNRSEAEKLSLSELLEGLMQDGFSTSRSVDLYTGRGVGVAAVIGAVHQCQGRIEVRSQPGQGAEFILILPRHQEEPLPALKVS